MTNGQYSQKYHPVLSYILSKLIPKNILNGLEMRCILGTFVLMNKKKKVKTLRSFGLRTYLSDSISWWFPPTLFPWHIGSAIKSCVFICSHNQLFSTFVGFSHNSVELVLATTTAGIDHPRITEAQPSY